MTAVGDVLTLIAKESERMLGPASPIGAASEPSPALIQPPRFPTPSMAAYGLLRPRQVAYQLPSVTKRDSASKEHIE